MIRTRRWARLARSQTYLSSPNRQFQKRGRHPVICMEYIHGRSYSEVGFCTGRTEVGGTADQFSFRPLGCILYEEIQSLLRLMKEDPSLQMSGLSAGGFSRACYFGCLKGVSKSVQVVA